MIESQLLANMGGDQVNILLKRFATTEVQEADKIISTELPMTITGFIIDIDEQFVYLSDTFGQDYSSCSNAIPKSEILLIQLVSNESELMGVVDDIGEPENGNLN